MRRKRAPFPRSVQMADEVLRSRGIVSPEEIDLEALLADFRILFRRALIGNAEGRLVRSGRRGIVTVDELAFLSEKWRFVLAHELGHFLLHAHRYDLSCFPKRGATRDEKSRSWLDEEAASHFAGALLVPYWIALAYDDPRATPMERARTLAAVFGVSLPTAALRLLDFTEEACAVAYAEKGIVVWCTATPGFKVNVPNRAPLPAGHVVGQARRVRADTWGHPVGAFGGAAVGALVEESVSLAPFDATVTMLWH